MDKLGRPGSGGSRLPTAETYKEIAKMQDEVNALAKENAALIAGLANIRGNIDEVREDIDMMHKALMSGTP